MLFLTWEYDSHENMIRTKTQITRKEGFGVQFPFVSSRLRARWSFSRHTGQRPVTTGALRFCSPVAPTCGRSYSAAHRAVLQRRLFAISSGGAPSWWRIHALSGATTGGGPALAGVNPVDLFLLLDRVPEFQNCKVQLNGGFTIACIPAVIQDSGDQLAAPPHKRLLLRLVMNRRKRLECPR